MLEPTSTEGTEGGYVTGGGGGGGGGGAAAVNCGVGAKTVVGKVDGIGGTTGFIAGILIGDEISNPWGVDKAVNGLAIGIKLRPTCCSLSALGNDAR